MFESLADRNNKQAAKKITLQRRCNPGIYVDVYRVEPLNNGHTGMSHFVHYRGVGLSLEVKNVLPL